LLKFYGAAVKKIILLLISPIFLFANFFNFKPVKITKDISCFIGDFNPILKSNRGFISNVCYIDMGNFLVLIDAGATYNFAKELNAFIEKSTNKKIKLVVITNYHDDRLLGASYFKEKGVKIVGASNMLKLIKAHASKYDRKKSLEIKGKDKNIFVFLAQILLSMMQKTVLYLQEILYLTEDL